MKLLLHICCAPCAIYPLEVLRQRGFQVRGYFYNPNIHPEDEFLRRRRALQRCSYLAPLKTIYPQYCRGDFFEALGGCKEAPLRCRLCWQMRLRAAAEYASREGFDYFTSTLLVSPYQDIEIIKELGNSLSTEKGVKFWGEDFRPGFREAHQKAKAEGLYCQKYCGCLYSLEERDEYIRQILNFHRGAFCFSRHSLLAD